MADGKRTLADRVGWLAAFDAETRAEIVAEVAAMEQQLAAANAEVSGLRALLPELDEVRAECGRLRQQLAAAQREREEARKDTARLDWLHGHMTRPISLHDLTGSAGWGIPLPNGGHIGALGNSPHLRVAIDNAMEAEAAHAARRSPSDGGDADRAAASAPEEPT